MAGGDVGGRRTTMTGDNERNGKKAARVPGKKRKRQYNGMA